MCPTPTYLTLEIIHISAIHYIKTCCSLVLPLVVSTVNKGLSSPMLLGTLMLGPLVWLSLWGYLCSNAFPSLSSFSFMASSHGLLFLRRHFACRFPKFSSWCSCNPPVGSKLFCLHTFFVRCAHCVLLLLPPDVRIHLFLSEYAHGLWGREISLSPNGGFEVFPNPSVNTAVCLVSGLAFHSSCLIVAPFPEPEEESASFAVLWTSVASL